MLSLGIKTVFLLSLTKICRFNFALCVKIIGSSVPWQDALEQLTKTREMSVRPILEFFDPLYKWLQETNKKNDDEPGKEIWSNYLSNWVIQFSFFIKIEFKE